MSAPSISGERVPIPRGRRARERVLRAALDVLADEGMPGFSVEAVAKRAGASKATVYRHWGSRGRLLVDAMAGAFQPFPLPDTGALRTDLLELLARQHDLLTASPFPRLMAAFMDAAERDPALAGLHVELTDTRREPMRLVLARARDRGEIATATDLELAVDLLAAPLFYRRFISHRPFPEAYATSLVDTVLSALSP